MTLLWILLGVLALLCAAAFVNLHLILEYDEEIRLHLRVLFIRIDLVKRFGGKTEKAESAPAQKEIKPAKKGPGGGSELIGFLQYLTRIVKGILKTFFRYARLKLCYLDIRVATEDAARTAKLYGLVCQAAYCLVEWVGHFALLKKNDKKITVRSDFTEVTCTMKLKLVVTLKPWQIIAGWIKVLPLLQYGKGKKDERNAIKASDRRNP